MIPDSSELATDQTNLNIPDSSSVDRNLLDELGSEGESPRELELKSEGTPSRLLIWIEFIIKILIRLTLIGLVVWMGIWWFSLLRFLLLNQAWANKGFHLDNSILNTIIGSTIANIFIMMRYIVKYFFPDKEELSWISNWFGKHKQ